MTTKRMIHVSVGDTKLPLRVSATDPTEEEVVRLAAKLIDKRLKDYQIKFSDKQKNDILAMVLLEFAKELILEKQKKEVLIDQDAIERIHQKLQLLNH